jgi:hypothetical protein
LGKPVEVLVSLKIISWAGGKAFYMWEFKGNYRNVWICCNNGERFNGGQRGVGGIIA